MTKTTHLTTFADDGTTSNEVIVEKVCKCSERLSHFKILSMSANCLRKEQFDTLRNVLSCFMVRVRHESDINLLGDVLRMKREPGDD